MSLEAKQICWKALTFKGPISRKRLSLSLYVCVYMYVYVCVSLSVCVSVCVCVCVCLCKREQNNLTDFDGVEARLKRTPPLSRNLLENLGNGWKLKTVKSLNLMQNYTIKYKAQKLSNCLRRAN